ncbi:uncharacterized protein FYW23_004880 isoform 1-T1 [Sylvia borin]
MLFLEHPRTPLAALATRALLAHGQFVVPHNPQVFLCRTLLQQDGGTDKLLPQRVEPDVCLYIFPSFMSVKNLETGRSTPGLRIIFGHGLVQWRRRDVMYLLREPQLTLSIILIFKLSLAEFVFLSSEEVNKVTWGHDLDFSHLNQTVHASSHAWLALCLRLSLYQYSVLQCLGYTVFSDNSWLPSAPCLHITDEDTFQWDAIMKCRQQMGTSTGKLDALRTSKI